MAFFEGCCHILMGLAGMIIVMRAGVYLLALDEKKEVRQRTKKKRQPRYFRALKEPIVPKHEEEKIEGSL